MHLKDGTPARPGDIIKTKSGTVGLIIGGNVNSSACNLRILQFKDGADSYGSGLTFSDAVRGDNNAIIEKVSLNIAAQGCITAGECERIAHVDIGNG